MQVLLCIGKLATPDSSTSFLVLLARLAGDLQLLSGNGRRGRDGAKRRKKAAPIRWKLLFRQACVVRAISLIDAVDGPRDLSRKLADIAGGCPRFDGNLRQYDRN